MTPPRTSMPMNTTGHGIESCSNIAVSAPINATVDPTERSMPPVVITKVMAAATISRGALWRRMFSTLLFEVKPSVATPKYRQTQTKKAAMLATPPLAISLSRKLMPPELALVSAIDQPPAPAERAVNFRPTIRLTTSSMLVSATLRSATF